jgi:hypothetical protein
LAAGPSVEGGKSGTNSRRLNSYNRIVGRIEIFSTAEYVDADRVGFDSIAAAGKSLGHHIGQETPVALGELQSVFRKQRLKGRLHGGRRRFAR